MTQDPSSPVSTETFEAVDDEATANLDIPLADLALPTRMAGWANRQGISRVSELLQWSPKALLAERNLGRTTLAQMRLVMERAFGSSWDELHHRAVKAARSIRPNEAEPMQASEPSESRISRIAWDDLAALLTPATLDSSIDELDLPTRMRNFAARSGIHRVGELVRIPHATLVETKNLGRKSLSQTFETLLTLHRCELEGPPPPPMLDEFAGFFDVWQRHQAELNPLDRLVVSQRASFHGPAPTLKDLGEMFNLSRERIRQLESRAIASLRRKGWWIEACEARLEQILDGGIRSLEEIESIDPFFEGIEERSETFIFFLTELAEKRLHVVDWDVRLLLGATPQSAWDTAFRHICNELASYSFPTPRSEVEARIAASLGELPNVAFRYVWERVRPLLFFNEDDDIVLGFGRYRGAEVSAFLLAAPHPIRVSELVERFGRGRLPDEVIFVERGLVGGPHHLPDYEIWAKRLPPICAVLMHRIAPERQFTTVELVEALREEAHLPRWLNAWTLGSILRNAHGVRYLGRNVVALPEVEGDRVHIRELFVSILEKAGGPLPASEILSLGAERRGTSGFGDRQLLSRAPFIDTEEGCIGLVQRDLPGGASALAAAGEALVTELERRQQGMLALESVALVRALSSTHASWNPAMVRSAARHDARLRLVSNGNVGLSEWEEVRAPNRRDLLASLLDEHRGQVPASAALDRIEAAFGVRLSLHALGCIAYSAGAKLTGQVISRADLVSAIGSSEIPHMESPLLRSIPAEAEPLFASLMREPIGDLNALSRQVNAHLARFEIEALGNEFLDMNEARRLSQWCQELLATIPLEPLLHRRQLVWAAVRYFAIDDDGNSDFTVGGLDDDRAVLDAVTAYLTASQNDAITR